MKIRIGNENEEHMNGNGNGKYMNGGGVRNENNMKF